MKVKSLVWLFVTLVVTGVLAFGVGSLPALGPVLEVRSGVWNHAETVLTDAVLPQLKESVTVTYDASGVPHIFALNEWDLYLVQGYLMASQRLYQMDISTRMAAGRLSEWFGARTQKMDEFFVRFGMRQSAQTMLAEFSKDQATIEMIDAFTAGVNLWIEQLEPSRLPAEYKILGRRPQYFDRLRVVFMAKSLTFNLTSRALDLPLTVLKKKLGPEKVLDLYPERLPKGFDDYVMVGFKSLSENRPAERPEIYRNFQTSLEKLPFFPISPRGQGSNNWAVGPAKSETGDSLFANDTHLALTLPNIWHEIQLSVPRFNVYGVSLISVPGIINGFSAKVAWGPTNGTTDVLDFYEIEFESHNSLRYRYKESWREAEVSQEVIKTSWAGSSKIPVVKTHLGFLLHREGKLGLVVNWMGHRTGNELKALRNLYEAQAAQDCVEDLVSWNAPIQNFLCVDKKNVMIQHTGFIPRRDVGVGRFVMDGRSADNPFDQRVPNEWQPRLENPKSGYVLSANQRIVDTRYPFFMGWDYEEPYRGMEIRKRLEAKSKLNVQDFLQLQNDAFDPQAEKILPYLLKYVVSDRLPYESKEFVEGLRGWNFQARAKEVSPALAKAWIKNLKKVLFDDEHQFAEDEADIYPASARLAWLLERIDRNPEDSDSQWVDDRTTEIKETLSDAVTAAFIKTWNRLKDEMGPDPKQWNWAKWNKVHLTHIGRLPGFGSDILDVDGSRESVRGINHRHGPVYKLVVQMADDPKAWIQVPGGNEGNPFSRSYGKGVKAWAQGEMRSVEFYKSEAEARQRASRVIQFKPREN